MRHCDPKGKVAICLKAGAALFLGLYTLTFCGDGSCLAAARSAFAIGERRRGYVKG